MSDEEVPISGEMILMMEDAEYGDLSHSTVSKRHVRILCALYQVKLQQRKHADYASMILISQLIEPLFNKRHTIEDVTYFTRDLVVRGYVASLREQDEDNDSLQGDAYAITSLGVELLERVATLHPKLFESNTPNLPKGLH
jgi:hypothetical protein